MASRRNRAPTAKTIEDLTKGLVDIAGTGPKSIRKSIESGIKEGFKESIKKDFSGSINQKPTVITEVRTKELIRAVDQQPKTFGNIASSNLDINKLLTDAVKSSLGTSQSYKTEIVSKRPDLVDDKTVKLFFDFLEAIKQATPEFARLKQEVKLSAEDFHKLIQTNAPLSIQQILTGFKDNIGDFVTNPDAATPRPLEGEGSDYFRKRTQADMAFWGSKLDAFVKHLVDIKTTIEEVKVPPIAAPVPGPAPTPKPIPPYPYPKPPEAPVPPPRSSELPVPFGEPSQLPVPVARPKIPEFTLNRKPSTSLGLPATIKIPKTTEPTSSVKPVALPEPEEEETQYEPIKRGFLEDLKAYSKFYFAGIMPKETVPVPKKPQAPKYPEPAAQIPEFSLTRKPPKPLELPAPTELPKLTEPVRLPELPAPNMGSGDSMLPAIYTPPPSKMEDAMLPALVNKLEEIKDAIIDVEWTDVTPAKPEIIPPIKPPLLGTGEPEPMLPAVVKPQQMIEREPNNKKMESFLESISENDCCEQLLRALADILNAIKGSGGSGGGGGRGRGRNGRDEDDDRILKDPFAPFTNYIQGIVNQLGDQVDDLQRTLLGFGTDVSKFQEFLGTSVDGLKGDAIQNLRNASDLYGKGFRENNKGLLTVANRMDLTNQNSKILLDEIPKLAIAFRIGSDSMNELGTNIDKFAQEYGVSTQRLIEELSKSKATKTAGELGFGKEFGENLSQLQAKFPQASEKIREFSDAITSGGKEYQMLIAAGAGDAVRRFEEAAKGADPAEFEAAFMDMASAMSKLDNQFTGMAESVGSGGQSMIFTFNKIKEDFGTGGVLASDVMSAMKNNKGSFDKVAEQNLKYEDSLKTLISEIKTNLLPIVIRFLEALKLIITPLKYLTDNVFVQFGLGFMLLRGFSLKLVAGFQSFGLALSQAVTQLTAMRASLAAGNAAGAAGAAGGAARLAGAAGAAGAAGGGAGGAAAFLAGPWGMAIMAAIIGGSMLYSHVQQKKEDRLQQVMDEQLKQQKLTNSNLKDSEKNNDTRAKSHESLYKSINRDLLVQLMINKNSTSTADDSLRQLVDETKNTNKLLSKIKDADNGLPSQRKK